MDELAINIAISEKHIRQLTELCREYHEKAEKYTMLEQIIKAELETKRNELAKYEAMQDKRERGK